MHFLTQSVFSRQPCKLDCDILSIKTLQCLSIRESRKLPPWTGTLLTLYLPLSPSACHFHLPATLTFGQIPPWAKSAAAFAIVKLIYKYIRKNISLKGWRAPAGLTITFSESPSSTSPTRLPLLQFSTTSAFFLPLSFSFPTCPRKSHLSDGSFNYYPLPQLENRPG